MTGVFLFPNDTMQSNILEAFIQGLAEEVACIFIKTIEDFGSHVYWI
jgi:hypothetical protein